MASLSTGTSPEVQHAIAQVVADSDSESSNIQQVVGKQLESRKTRPGLLQVITGAESRGNTNHKHKNMSNNNERKGLLDGFFDSGKKSSSAKKTTQTNRRTTSKTASSSNSLRETNNEPVDWDGIPYHSVNASGSRTAKSPMRDTKVSASGGQTRIIRGGSTKPIQATPASVRTNVTSGPNSARPLAQPVREPRMAAPVASSTAKLSSSSSSRRSNRRSVDTLDAADVAAATSQRSNENRVVPNGDEPDLVPRVIRRKDTQAESKPAPKVAGKPAPKVAAKPATITPAPANVAAKPVAPAPTPAAAAPTTTSAVASIQRPAATPARSPSETPAQPAAPQPQYSLPVDPATAPIPVASLPTHPYAASTPRAATPAMSVSHRAGPPSAAFGTAPIANPSFHSAATPVGSGIVPNSDVAPYRRPMVQLTQPSITPSQPAQQPAFQMAQRPAADPYASRPMTTYNRPGTRPAHQTATVPMQPINGYAPARTQTQADSFARTTFDNRNQMRDGTPSKTPTGGTAASELPGIRVITYGPDSVMLRQTNQYEIRIENRGSIDATGVMVRTLVPDWADVGGQNATLGNVAMEKQGSAERMVWKIDSLPAGATERLLVSLTAARSGTFDLDVDWTMLPQKSVATVHVHEPKLNVTIEGPDQVVYGQSQTYKVRVLNPGDGIAPNVMFTLSPNSATPQTQRIGDIPPGKEAQFDVELTAQDLGDLKIHGLANGDYELRAESQKTIRVSAAQLEAILTGPELKYQNTPASYSLQIQNSGQATSDKIIATLRLPAGVEYLGGIDGAQVQNKMLRWEINSLAPGATRNYKFGCNMTTTGEHQFLFDCRGTAAGNADVSIATRVESISDLVLTINDPIAPAPIGSNVTYEIVIRNRGSKEATSVRAVAQFSHGIEPQRIEGQSGEIVTGQVLFDEIPRIGAGQEIRLRVVAQAERAGHHRFRTEVRSGDTVLVAEEATHYMSPQSDRVSRKSTNSNLR
ncbi:MAG: hypothetical protein AB8B91_12005 [Rubripirellula sp.]